MRPNSLDAGVDQRVGDRRVGRRTREADRAADAFGRLRRGIGVAAVDHDARALSGKQFGDGESDAAGAADDDGAAAGGSDALIAVAPPGRTASRPCSSSRAGW